MNTQPAEKPISLNDLDIIKIWSTIQGEGPFAGRRATFLRLAGCNWDCPACDTDYTTGRRLISVHSAVHQILDLPASLVVLTGGEPLRQTQVGSLIRSLISHGLTVQIETNGTLCPPGVPYHDERLTIVCSPKAPTVNPQLAPAISAYKYVLEAGYINARDGLPERILGCTLPPARPSQSHFIKARPIYVQPLDDPEDASRNPLHVQAAVKSCLEYGYVLCLQTHKLVGLE